MTWTTEELYEQAKRILRASLPDDVAGEAPFLLACTDCGLAFARGAEVGMLKQHSELAHGHGDASVPLDLVWIGEGPPPEARP